MKQLLTKNGEVDRRTLRVTTMRPGMKFDPQKAKRVEVVRNKTDGRPWKTYIYDCVKCGENEVRMSHGTLYSSMGMCRSCAAKKRPYEYILGALKASARHKNQDVTLTYEEFIGFVEVGECHYCGSHIDWKPHAIGENYPKGYYLDRKNNLLGYSKENCVPCCTTCNFIRQDKLTYEEMLKLKGALTEIMRSRLLASLSEIQFTLPSTTEFQ